MSIALTCVSEPLELPEWAKNLSSFVPSRIELKLRSPCFADVHVASDQLEYFSAERFTSIELLSLARFGSRHYDNV